jgi:hypothetical protein
MDISVVEFTSSERDTGAIELVHEVNISASEVGVAREDSLVESDLESIVGWMTEEVMEVAGPRLESSICSNLSSQRRNYIKLINLHTITSIVHCVKTIFGTLHYSTMLTLRIMIGQ